MSGEITLAKCKKCGIFYPADEKHRCNMLVAQAYQQGREDAIDDAMHHLDNAKTNCHEDYIDGIDFAVGVLQSIMEQLKEQI